MEEHQIYKGIKVHKVDNEFEENLELLERNGFFILNSVLDTEYVNEIKLQLDKIWESQLIKYGKKLLKTIGDWGQVRALMDDNKIFKDLIVHPEILKYVDSIIGDTAILHLQNGIILHPTEKHNQAKYHKDFPKDFLSNKLLSLNAFVAIDKFTDENGGTWLLPGSHKFSELPSQYYIKKNQIQINCEPGSIVFFDSTLWHKGGDNLTKKIRRAINHQYTRPFIKQQLDYPVIMSQKVNMETKLAQKLGMWTIPPKSVDEYRVTDPKLRTYRGGQG